MKTNWLTEAWHVIQAMGRPRADMIALVKSEMRDTVQEHLWKLFAYHAERSNDTAGWTKTLEERRRKFSLCNEAKGKNRKNLTLRELEDYFVTELFEAGDCRVLGKNFSYDGYPLVELNNAELLRLQNLAKRFCSCIYNETRFSAGTSELL
jgi:hypothetical protein